MAIKTKTIKGFPDYEVTSKGEVYSYKNGERKLLKPLPIATKKLISLHFSTGNLMMMMN